MDLITCPHCLFSFEPAAGQKPPPWCRRCGGDLRARPVGAAEPAEEFVPLTAAPAARPAGRWASRGDAPAVTTPPPTAAADTPAPGRGRWANQRSRDRRLPAPTNTWSADMDRRVEELAAQELAAAGVPRQPPAFECYLFVVACALLPVFTLGGGLWFAVGFGGASTCAKLAHSHTVPRPFKFLACLGVTAGAWGLFVLLLLVANRLAPRR